MIQDAPKYRLVNTDLLKLLMKRTGTGDAVSVRGLAQGAGVASGTVGMLLTGARDTVSATTAQAIAQRLGVDLLVLWVPAERADSSTPHLRLTDTA